jgi:hypothetical protein
MEKSWTASAAETKKASIFWLQGADINILGSPPI